MAKKAKFVMLTLSAVDEADRQFIEIVQCPSALEHMHTCNGILHCDHALPHFPTKSCGDSCKTIVSVIM